MYVTVKLHSANPVLLRSVPIRKSVKRFWLSRYRKLQRCNGDAYASKKFGDIQSSIKGYLSNGRISPSGCRKNGWFKALLREAKHNPPAVLAFLELLKSSDSKAGSLFRHSVMRFGHTLATLNELPPNSLFTEWIKVLSQSDRMQKDSMHSSPLNRGLSGQEWIGYWRKWKKIFLKVDPVPFDWNFWPESYRDFRYSDSSSDGFDRDLKGFVDWCKSHRSPVTSWLLDFHNPDVKELVSKPSGSPFGGVSSSYAGEVHFVSKSGYAMRPVAATNRFLQVGLLPLFERLRGTTVGLGFVDAEYDQARFDANIESRVACKSKYVRSLDLTMATERLPWKWIHPLLEQMCSSDDEKLSLQLFVEMCSAEWKVHKVSEAQNWSRPLVLPMSVVWERGQPLGSLPSFSVLTLCHVLMCEIASLSVGITHSPYRILGDDVVLFNKTVASRYLSLGKEMDLVFAPEKSFGKRLVEFAGKVFIRDQPTFFLPKDRVLTWTNLFDWSRASGIRIPWNNLPRIIKRRFQRKLHDLQVQDRKRLEWAAPLNLSARELYELSMTCEVEFATQVRYHRSRSWPTGVIGSYGAMRSVPESSVLPRPLSRTSLRYAAAFKTFMQVAPERLRSPSGQFWYYIQSQDQRRKAKSWWFDKFRPVSTDRVVEITHRSIREHRLTKGQAKAVA